MAKKRELLVECQERINREFDLLAEDWDQWQTQNFGTLDGNSCKRRRDDCDGITIPWLGFSNTRFAGKCLPYYSDQDVKNMVEVCNTLSTDPTIQGAVSKLVNFVVGPRGHSYSVSPREGLRKPDSRANSRVRSDIELAIDHAMESISMGSKKGFAALQKETFRRKIRGEYFRTFLVTRSGVEVRFIEPHTVTHPGSVAAVRNPSPYLQDLIEENPRQPPPGKYGIHYRPEDAANVLGVFEYDPDPNDTEKTHTFHDIANLQHGKMLGDSNDERGVGLFYYSYRYIQMAGKIMDSLFRISQIQAKYAAIWTFAEAARVGKIRKMGEQVAKDDDRPEEISPGEHMGRGWEIDLPSTKIRTNQWTDIIGQLLRFAGASADLPDFMMSSLISSGRSNLIAAEGPFDISCQGHQHDLNDHDIPLLWVYVASHNAWSISQFEDAKSKFKIRYKATSAATRDFHRVVSSLIELMIRGVMAPEEVANRTGADWPKAREWWENMDDDERAAIQGIRSPSEQSESPSTGGAAPGGE